MLMGRFSIVTHIKYCNINLPLVNIASLSSDLPDGCIHVRGPHSLDCLTSVWLSVGCLQEGYSFPENMTESSTQRLADMMLG